MGLSHSGKEQSGLFGKEYTGFGFPHCVVRGVNAVEKPTGCILIANFSRDVDDSYTTMATVQLPEHFCKHSGEQGDAGAPGLWGLAPRSGCLFASCSLCHFPLVEL